MMTNVSTINLVMTTMFGIVVLAYYIYFLPYVPNVWGTIPPRTWLRTWICISVGLSAVAYLFFWVKFVFLSTTLSSPSEWCFTIGNALFLIGAMSWPLALYYRGRNRYGVFVLGVLCLTSIGASLLWTSSLCITADGDMWTIIAASYLLFHVLIMDNIIWWKRYRLSISLPTR